VKTLKLTDKAKIKLKEPLGLLLKGSPEENALKIKQLIKNEKPQKIITVGDVVTDSLINVGITPDLYIIDNKTMRGNYTHTVKLNKNIKIKNKKGSINTKVWDTIKHALEEKIPGILVDGEEDLLGIPCVLLSPIGSFVIYGQPNEGMVIIKVNPKSIQLMQEIIDEMEEE